MIGGRQTAEKELSEINDAIAHEGGSINQLFKPGLRRALGVALFLAIVSELSGITVVFYYGPGILEKAGFKLGDCTKRLCFHRYRQHAIHRHCYLADG